MSKSKTSFPVCTGVCQAPKPADQRRLLQQRCPGLCCPAILFSGLEYQLKPLFVFTCFEISEANY